jgi:ATP-dependent helicase/nuclease subunit B
MKNIFTIPSEVSFLDALAAGLWARAAGDVAQLADMRIFLPTRRACRMLREAFLRLTEGRATLLPRMQPMGNIDEDELLFADATIEAEIPPAIAPLRRRLLLAQLIKGRDESLPVDQAVHLAEALALFLDEAQIRRCDFTKLAGLVQNRELAKHWEETVRFLSLLTDAWPQILAAEGCIDPAERRNRVLAAQAAAWRAQPPAHPIIAAGSTGTMPATADFLDAIASLPSGAVVLPGLDHAMDEESWQAVDELHPQYGMKELLSVMKAERTEVAIWPAALPLAGGEGDGLVRFSIKRDHNTSVMPAKAGIHLPSVKMDSRQSLRDFGNDVDAQTRRVNLLREAMRPANVTEMWRDLRPDTIPLAAVEGLSRVTFAHPQEEAQAVALMLRRALEEPTQSVALVTPDRALAERVATLLTRWGIEANDSAGTSLAEQPVGSFLSGVLAAASPTANAVDWLALLKHPFAACGLAPADCRARARHLELAVWRTEEPEPAPWLESLKKTLEPITAAWSVERPLAAWMEDHLRLAEQMAASDQDSGATRLWQGEQGDAVTEWLDELRGAAINFAPVTGEVYENLFTELLRQANFRPAYGLHPRLSILGPLEARMLRPDVVVLGGMNEGVWPPEVAVDPWMSRPMKRDFGMAPAEYRIGLAAHDFVQLATAPQVIMTRSLRSGGAPTVPSRFLLQLETVLRALGHSDKTKDALKAAEPWRAWARMLDEPLAAEIKPCAAPEPRPPVALRPNKLSVTEISAWQRNPYAIYARHVLGLRKLDPLEAEIDAADRGNLIHKALEQFVHAHPVTLPPDALEKLLAIGRNLFTAYDEHPEVKAFWWPRFEGIATWFIAKEEERRALGTRPVKVEAAGHIALDGFTLKGRADRIDRLADGSLSITDYKTGGVPSKKEVESGIEPQLPLLALIAERGGFNGVTAAKSGELAYWKLSGGRNDDSNKETRFAETLEALVTEAESGLKNLVTTFADPATAYQAVPKPGRAPRYDDYAHLARLAEWGRTDED